MPVSSPDVIVNAPVSSSGTKNNLIVKIPMSGSNRDREVFFDIPLPSPRSILSSAYDQDVIEDHHHTSIESASSQLEIKGNWYESPSHKTSQRKRKSKVTNSKRYSKRIQRNDNERKRLIMMNSNIDNIGSSI